MSQLITLSKLASLVSENTGIELNVCEAFIRNMAQAITSGLAEGEHVRIKNFGLFESRQTPDGNSTVEFIPETVFSEIVNASFAHLHPTIASVGEAQNIAGPDISTFPPVQGERMAPQAIPPQQPIFPHAQQPQFPNPQVHEQQPAWPQHTVDPQDQPYTHANPQQQEQPAWPQQPENPQTRPYTQDTAFPPEPNPNDISQTSIFTEQPHFPQDPCFSFPPQSRQNESAAYHSLQGASQSGRQDASYTSTSPYNDKSLSKRNLPQLSTNKKYVLIGVLGLIAGFTLGYFTGVSTSKESAPQDNIEDTSIAEATTPRAIVPEYDYSSSVSVADVDTFAIDDTDDHDTKSDASSDAPDPQIITVTLNKGERLSDIAKRYYGEKDYWVYIYLENDKVLKNPFSVRAGTVLTVPPKNKYAPTTNETENLRRAKALGEKINSKYMD